MRDGERLQGDEMRIKIEVLQLLYSFGWQQKCGGAASLCKAVGEMEERRHVTDGKPWEHHQVKI